MSSADLARRIELACLLEAAARKPGNVHPWAAFDDLCFHDFVAAAAAIAPVLAETRSLGLGRAVLAAVEATRRTVATNANLGIILLLAPLCAVSEEVPSREAIDDILRRTTVDDAVAVYKAIRLARPGGLGTAENQDVTDVPTCTLRQAMQLASDRDLVARQYANSFDDVLWLADQLDTTALISAGRTDDWDVPIVLAFLRMLARQPDTLISRKCGVAMAAEVSRRAQTVAFKSLDERLMSDAELREFDRWLREAGHRHNPGATADLTAASLFVALGAVRISDLPQRQAILKWANFSW